MNENSVLALTNEQRMIFKTREQTVNNATIAAVLNPKIVYKYIRSWK